MAPSLLVRERRREVLAFLRQLVLRSVRSDRFVLRLVGLSRGRREGTH